MGTALTKMGIQICRIGDQAYPDLLRSISGCPSVLYYKGHIEFLNHYRCVAVVGSRNCSEKGRKLAYTAGMQLGQRGISVVNGLAIGCDTEALKGALKGGSQCVAILPGGLEEIVPKCNQRLAEQIVETGGCLLSEYPAGTGIQKHQYVMRDRLQSGISHGVIVVEAELRSGTMHTADFALQQHRRLACYYHQLLEHSSGNEYLEKKGKAAAISDEKDLDSFLNSLSEIQNYEQMSLF